MVHNIFYRYPVSRQNMHLAPPGANTCDNGSVVQSECEAASQIFATDAGKTQERSMQVGSGGKCLDGSWGQVPLGCSVQSGGDWTPHYKTGNLDTGVGCIHEHYQLVCYDSGMLNLLIVCVVFSFCIIILQENFLF